MSMPPLCPKCRKGRMLAIEVALALRVEAAAWTRCAKE